MTDVTDQESAIPLSPQKYAEFSPRSVSVLIGLLAAAILLPTVLALSVFPVVMQAVIAENHWSRAQASFAPGLLQIGIMINSPIMGFLIRRWGPKSSALTAIIISALFMALAGWLGNISLFAFCAMYGLIGLTTAGFMPFYAIASGWFHQRRALAFGVIAAGGTAAIMLAPLVASELIRLIGWRMMYSVLAIAVCGIAVPAFWLLAREHPSVPKLETAKGGSVKGPAMRALKQAMAGRKFWMLAVAQACATGATAGILTHGVAMLTDRGLSPTLGALAISAAGLGAFLAQGVSGFILDQFNTPKAAIPFALTAIVGVLLMQWSTIPVWGLAGALLVGVGGGGETTQMAYFVTQFFGRVNYSQIYGSMMPVITIVSAAIPISLGLSFDAIGTYQMGYWILCGLFILCALMFWFIGPYTYAAVPVETETETPAE